ncbi:MAG: hypothetical protein DYG89_29745 [Caldilinea sp. CFX5]|nr:hypothetical protein [Caldilinea sp. CFX5]
MTSEVGQSLITVNASILQPIVQRLLADETATLIDWSGQALDGGFSGSTVQRWQGKAQTAYGVQAWSLICKVINPSTGSAQPTAWDYWQREALVYQSGVLADLPADLVAPRCFAITAQPGEELWLWLEDMSVTADDEWPLERYGLAARHFGQFNGAYLVGRPLPLGDWWCGADIRHWLSLAEPGIHELPHFRHHPLFAELLAGDRVERIQQLWAERERLLAGLDRLPQTLCHRDAFRRNLMARQRADGREQTVVLDWATIGLGVLGEELVPLFAATLSFVAVPLMRIAKLDELIFAGYVAGLREAGWQGDERLARFGFTALAALKAGVADPATRMPSVARRAAALPPDAEPPRLLSPGGYPQAAARATHLLTMGEEALQLLDSSSI